MERLRGTRRTVAVSLVAAVIAAMALVVLAPGASAVTGTAGPATVTVTPTDNLTNGQTVTVSATFAAGTVSDMRAHLCKPGANITVTGEFDLDGPFCSPNPVSPQAHIERAAPGIAPTDTSATLTFNVGVGTGASWQPIIGPAQTLTCDSTHPCDLVTQFQAGANTVFFTAPLTFQAPPHAPGPPTGVSAFAGDTQVTVSWVAPVDTGSSTIDSYTVTQNGTALPNVPGTQTSLVITGLTNGTTYSYTVHAHNLAGFTSIESSPVASATPSALQRNVLQPITVTRPLGELVMTQACSTATGGNPYPDEAIPAGNITTPPSVTYGAATQAGCTVALGSAKLLKGGVPGAGQFFKTTGPIREITIVDGRDTDPGWSVSGSVSQFSAGAGKTFSGNDLGWEPSSSDTGPFTADGVTYDQLVTPAGLVSPAVTGDGIVAGLGLGSNRTLASAAPLRGLGIARLNANLTLLLPIFAKTGNYTSTLTVTAIG